MRARDAPSVVMISPIGSRDGASMRVPATAARPPATAPSTRCDRIANANQAAPATSTSDAAAVRSCIAAAANGAAAGARRAAAAAAV